MTDQKAFLKSMGGGAHVSRQAAASANAARPSESSAASGPMKVNAGEPPRSHAQDSGMMPQKVDVESMSLGQPAPRPAAPPRAQQTRRDRQQTAPHKQQIQQSQEDYNPMTQGCFPGMSQFMFPTQGCFPGMSPFPAMSPGYPPQWGMFPPMVPGMYPGMDTMQGYPAMLSSMSGGCGMQLGGMQGQAGMGAGPGGGGGKNQPKAAQAGKERTRRRGNKKGTRDRPMSPPPPPDAAAMDADNDANRSLALNEVRRTSKNCRITLAEAMPHVLEFAQDQHGSRFLQNKLDEASESERDKVLEALRPEASKMASHQFANFVVSKIFDVGTAEQKKALVTDLREELLRLSKDSFGCRVVQKAIQHVSRESQQTLAEELRKDVVGCIESLHGNHVIQKCIEQMPPDSVTFIISAIEEQTEKMAIHSFGCRVIQRLFEHCAPTQLEGMRHKLLIAIDKLAYDAFGNYVVQHMLEHGRVEDIRTIIGEVQRNLVGFAKQKHSSNVVEKCFEVASVGEHASELVMERDKLMRTVLGDGIDPEPPLKQMMDDKFGNYIVQRMLEHGRGENLESLRQRLLTYTPVLENSTNGKHILKALSQTATGLENK